MIRGLILYYLNIKSTHGYEIQRFIQVSGMDQWTRVQSGSIYYALAKLEKEQCIRVLREERNGSRIRKVYEITENGRKELKKEMQNGLAMPLMEVGSMKHIIYPMIHVLSPQETRETLKKHISALEEKKRLWESWREVKVGLDHSRLTRLSFDMTIHSLEEQMEWHQELLSGLEKYREESEDMVKMIQLFEPDSIPNESKENSGQQKLKQERLAFVEKIKESVETDPKQALEQLNQIMEEIKKQTV